MKRIVSDQNLQETLKKRGEVLDQNLNETVIGICKDSGIDVTWWLLKL